ncbi:MAG: large repetitive protein, partial [Phycisphaerales bacterium]|nr:large repetitive protein [Phycisphaerales bacterium]
MAENYPADPANPNLPPQQPDPSAAPAPAPKRRRKRWPWVIVGILLLLILLVALAPTLISSGPGKSFIVGKINNSLNGKLDVADLSIGWLSGVTLNGVKIDDQQGRRVLEIASVRVPISLIGAARGKYDLGDTVIDKPNLVNLEIYEDGSTNLGKLMKDSGGNATPPAAPPDQTSPQPTQPTKIPDIKGKITINQARATVSGPAVRSPIHLESGDVVVNIPNINSEITNDAKFVYRVGQSPPGTITIVGAIDAIENNIVNVDKLAADEKIQITSADLAGIEPFLQSPGAKTTLAGIASGALQLKSA